MSCSSLSAELGKTYSGSPIELVRVRRYATYTLHSWMIEVLLSMDLPSHAVSFISLLSVIFLS